MVVSRAVLRSRSKDIQRRAARKAEGAFERRFHLGIEMRLMDGASDRTWHNQWEPFNDRTPPNGGWNWPNERSWCERNAKRMGVALWHQDILCALALAVTNKNAVNLRLVEGNPAERHPLSGDVLLAVTLLFEVYQCELGLNQMKIIAPAPALIPKYVALGYELASSQNGDTIMHKET